MVNERLHRAMRRAGLDLHTLASAAEVSSVSVEGWVSGGAVPYPGTRYRVAAILREDEADLWPGATNGTAFASTELVDTYARRSDVPRHLWTEFLRRADRAVDLLVPAGSLPAGGHPAWLPRLAAAARRGARVRLLLSGPEGRLMAREAEDLSPAAEVRLHDAPLFNSVYRFDDDMLVNTHAYGVPAALTPVLHLRRLNGPYFATYLRSFDEVWAPARTAGAMLEAI